MVMSYDKVILYFDGASKNNPAGPAGCGWVLYEMDENGVRLRRIAGNAIPLGMNVTSNQAEYKGLIHGMRYVHKHISCKKLFVRGDSELIIKQMKRLYKVESPNLIPFYNHARGLRRTLRCRTVFKHIPRGANHEADCLANKGAELRQ